MLAGAVRELVDVGHPVAVVARRRQSILRVAESCAAPDLVLPVVGDYQTVHDGVHVPEVGGLAVGPLRGAHAHEVGPGESGALGQ